MLLRLCFFFGCGERGGVVVWAFHREEQMCADFSGKTAVLSGRIEGNVMRKKRVDNLIDVSPQIIAKSAV